MTHVLLDCTNAHAEATARRFGLQHLARTVWRREDGFSVLIKSSADRARHVLTAADTLYLGSHWLFAHGDVMRLIHEHEAVGGAVMKDTGE